MSEEINIRHSLERLVSLCDRIITCFTFLKLFRSLIQKIFFFRHEQIFQKKFQKWLISSTIVSSRPRQISDSIHDSAQSAGKKKKHTQCKRSESARDRRIALYKSNHHQSTSRWRTLSEIQEIQEMLTVKCLKIFLFLLLIFF